MDDLWYCSLRFRGFPDGRCDLVGAHVRTTTANAIDFNDTNAETREVIVKAVRDWLEKVDP